MSRAVSKPTALMPYTLVVQVLGTLGVGGAVAVAMIRRRRRPTP